MDDLTDLLDRHARVWATPTPVPRLVLCRADAVTGPAPAVYPPLPCVLARGRKPVTVGDDTFDYDPGHVLIASADLPVTGRVTAAPSLGCVLTPDLPVLAELIADLRPDAGDPDAAALKAMPVRPIEPDLLDPILRLVRLLDRAADVPVLAPLIEREILYRLLVGPHGATLRQAVRPGAPLARVARAIAVLRRRSAEPLRVEELARVACMSPTSFHRHCRAATALSPLPFQKQLRLGEARRLLLPDGDDAAGVAVAVGYESPSQFGREYRRLFGVPPDRAGRTREPVNAWTRAGRPCHLTSSARGWPRSRPRRSSRRGRWPRRR